MRIRISNELLCVASLFFIWIRISSAAPAAQPAAFPAVVPTAVVTPSPVEWVPTRTTGRGLRDDVHSILGKLGSNIPFIVASVVAEFFERFPSGSALQSSLGLASSQLAALPTQVLNIPSYSNWTDQGWNLRFHGNIYKQPDISREKLDDLANVFLINTDIEDLPLDQQAQARNVTAEIFIVQQGNKDVSFHVEPAPSFGSSGEPGGGGAVTPSGGSQSISLPYPTTGEGDFDVFLPIRDNGLQSGNATDQLQRLNVYADGTDTGNATSFLVPPTGLTILSDIDDILRVTKIYRPKEALLNSFARPFTPWMNMPEVYSNWSQTLPNLHFHYLTTTPEQGTRNYIEFIYNYYPGGSFDTRPLNFSDVEATLSIRKHLLTKIFQTFPQRKFILVADTSNSDVMRAYPAMVTEFPDQVQCIFLRNTTATDPSDKFPYNTEGFKNLNPNMYMFFIIPVSISSTANATINQSRRISPLDIKAFLSASISVLFASIDFSAKYFDAVHDEVIKRLNSREVTLYLF